MPHRSQARRARKRTLRLPAWLLVSSTIAIACAPVTPTASPSELDPTSQATQAPTAITADPGPKPTPAYPDLDAIGLGQLTISAPVHPIVRFWLTCEWSSGERVEWLYTGGGTAAYPGSPIVLFGEPVTFYVSNLLDGAGDPYSVALNRFGNTAPYRIEPTSVATLSHNDDWTVGTLRFDDLRLDPSAWDSSPPPTPREAFERPLGGEAGATDLSGVFEWECDPRPATLPPSAAGPSKTSPVGYQQPT